MDKETKIAMGKLFDKLDKRITRLETNNNKIVKWIKDFQKLNR